MARKRRKRHKRHKRHKRRKRHKRHKRHKQFCTVLEGYIPPTEFPLLIGIGFLPEKKQSTCSKSRQKTLYPLFSISWNKKSMLIRPSLWPLSYTSMSLLEMGVEPTTKGLLCMLYSPTEIQTPDGWFKVISDNHFTIGEGDHKSSKNNSEHVVLPNLPNKPTTHHHDYDSLRRGRNPNWFYVR